MRLAPPLTDEAVKKELGLTLEERWRRQARRLTAAIRGAESAGDDDRVGALQTDLRAPRSRRAQL